MKDMEKDQFIEEKIGSYLEGTAPDVDLTAAKRALREETAKRRSAKRRTLIALASACACLLLLAIVLVGLLPSFAAGGGGGEGTSSDASPSGGSSSDVPPSEGDPSEGETGGIVYRLEAAKTRAAGVSELSAKYGDALKKLTSLGVSTNVSADYTVYTMDGRDVLLGTEILYFRTGRRVSAVVYTDLSGGTYLAEELFGYDALPKSASRYDYGESFVNGEYCCLGRCTVAGQAYCVSLQSSDRSAFFDFMDYLT